MIEFVINIFIKKEYSKLYHWEQIVCICLEYLKPYNQTFIIVK